MNYLVNHREQMNIEMKQISTTPPPEIIIPEFQNSNDTYRIKKEDTHREKFYETQRRRRMYFYIETCIAFVIICITWYVYLGK